MDVSVLISVRNGEKFLAEAIDSVLAQSFRDFEIVVVDDGSTDRTDGILDEYLRRSKRLKKIRLCHRGQTAALNVGLALVSGKYVVRLDADDIAVVDRIEQQFDFMERNPEVVACGSAVEFVDPDGDSLSISECPQIHDRIFESLLRGMNPLIHSAAIIRSECVKAVGGYDESYLCAAEFDLWLKLAEHGRLSNLAEPLIRKRLHVDSFGNQNRKLIEQCIERAGKNYRRRHQEFSKQGRGGVETVAKNGEAGTPESKKDLARKWLQMAIESGNLKTASKYAWRETLGEPFLLEHWIRAAKLQIQAAKKAA